MAEHIWRGLVLISLFVSALSFPKTPRDVSPLDSCIGKSTKVIARAMLQGYVDSEENVVFSPLGYASLMALLAEGAHGDTEKEISEILHLHRENVKQRNEFKAILSTLTEKYRTNKPQLRTWFYVYKNYSVEESYKNTLKEYYKTEVKNVYPVEFEDVTITKVALPAENDPEDSERFSLDEDIGNSAYYEKQIIKQAEKEDELFKSGVSVQEGSLTHLSTLNDDPSAATEESKEDGDVLETSNTTNHNNLSIEDVKQEPNQQSEDNNEAEEVEEKLKANEKFYEKTQAFQEKVSSGTDPINFLPASFKKGRQTENDEESLIILFNGYYFEGTWEIPFAKNVSVCHFYLNDTATVNASTIKTKGAFQAGDLPHLNSSAISIPFEGGRYSLVIILPNEVDGLDQLTSDLNDTTLQEVVDSLETKELEVQIPKFNLESTTNPEPSLTEIGVTSIFGEDADLRSISKTGALHAQELVQLVTMKITGRIGTTNYMTAASVSSRSIKDKFIADHPFLFFIEDKMYNVTVVAGKLLDPTNPL
ncbi:serpin B5 [Ischnura elegans]|uniref:serpin B5 n=1 Tax=Ischnura elegans TaxID=197161 RepID=UPI001ED89064|nr:serpin B5 [Ischnura elegans]